MDPKRTGNQSIGLISPSEECWEIKGKIDDMSASELTFVVEVRIGTTSSSKAKRSSWWTTPSR